MHTTPTTTPLPPAIDPELALGIDLTELRAVISLAEEHLDFIGAAPQAEERAQIRRVLEQLDAAELAR